jgi:hypothetical protein
MNTYLLIPMLNIPPEYEAMIELLQEELIGVKQISLDEKAIEIMANKAYPYKNEVDYDTGVQFDGNQDFRIGYKQALYEITNGTR